jgi:hypothetical protein
MSREKGIGDKSQSLCFSPPFILAGGGVLLCLVLAALTG